MVMDAADKANLKLRILSAGVLIPVSLGAIYIGGVIYNLFITVFAGVAIYEWMKLAQKTNYSIILSILGFLYIACAGFSIYTLREWGWDIPLLFFSVVWASDIGAYLFGKWIGGRKMLPNISPNKTWAGFLGACLFPVFIFFAWIFLQGKWDADEIFVFMPIGFFFGFLCQVGDLIVSKLKRVAGQKDSGILIPGHGGVLDRIDALLLSSIFFAALLIWLSWIGPF